MVSRSLDRAIVVHLNTFEVGCLKQGVLHPWESAVPAFGWSDSHSILFDASVCLMHSEEEGRADLSRVAGGFTLPLLVHGEQRQNHGCSLGCLGQPAVGTPQDAFLLYAISIPGQKENKHIKVKWNLEAYTLKNTGIPKPFCFSDWHWDNWFSCFCEVHLNLLSCSKQNVTSNNRWFLLWQWI